MSDNIFSDEDFDDYNDTDDVHYEKSPAREPVRRSASGNGRKKRKKKRKKIRLQKNHRPTPILFHFCPFPITK